MFTNNLKLGVTVTITRRKGSAMIHWHATAGVCQRLLGSLGARDLARRDV